MGTHQSRGMMVTAIGMVAMIRMTLMRVLSPEGEAVLAVLLFWTASTVVTCGNPSSYSKLEGQVRSATDKEVLVIAKILGIPMEELFTDPSSQG